MIKKEYSFVVVANILVPLNSVHFLRHIERQIVK